MNKNPLTPVMHPTLHDHHRVPMAEIGGQFEIYVGEDFVRIFKEEELPDVIKVRLAMIRAATVSEPVVYDLVSIMKYYEHPKESQLYEIGWKVTDTLYMVVIPTKDLTYLRNSRYSPSAYRKVENIGFIADDKPTYKFLEDFIQSRYATGWTDHRSVFKI